MTIQAATQVVDRAFNEASIRWAVANIDGDQALYLGLPSGFGDCALLEVSANVTAIDVIQALYESSGPMFGIFDGDTTAIPVDSQFCGRWQLHVSGANNLGVAAHASPDQVQWWREQEVLRIQFPEIDTDATPTADLTVIAKVRRLRGGAHAAEEEHFFLTS